MSSRSAITGLQVIFLIFIILLFFLLTLIFFAKPPSAPEPAEFSVTDLKMSPAEAWIGQPITISTKVTNIGGDAGSHVVELTINDVVEQTETVMLEGGASTTVEFRVMKEEKGNYSVMIDSLSGTFNVKAPAG